jgi:hypothetical protein
MKHDLMTDEAYIYPPMPRDTRLGEKGETQC